MMLGACSVLVRRRGSRYPTDGDRDLPKERLVCGVDGAEQILLGVPHQEIHQQRVVCPFVVHGAKGSEINFPARTTAYLAQARRCHPLSLALARPLLEQIPPGDLLDGKWEHCYTYAS